MSEAIKLLDEVENQILDIVNAAEGVQRICEITEDISGTDHRVWLAAVLEACIPLDNAYKALQEIKSRAAPVLKNNSNQPDPPF